MRRVFILCAAALLAITLSGCGDRAMRCTPLHKGYPLCGL